MNSAHDPIGAASARLLAAGIARHDRMFALRVLGLLLDHADRDGVVHILPSTLAGEFDLDRVAVETAFLQLRTAGVLVPAPAGWHIDGYEGYDRGGVNAGAALALIADLLDGPLVDPPPAPRALSTLVARAYPALTGVLVVLLVLVAAGGRTDPSADREVALRVAGVEHDDLPEQPVDAEPVREPRRTPTSATGWRPDLEGARPTLTAPPSTAASSSAAASASSATSETIDPPPPTSAPGTPSSPACPQGAPLAEVVEVRALPVPSTGGLRQSMAVPVDEAGWSVTIDGTLENASGTAMVVERLEVVVATDDGEQVLDVLDEPVLLAPGGVHDWSISTATSLTTPPPDETDVETIVRVWRWAEACG